MIRQVIRRVIRYVDTSCLLRLMFGESGPALVFDGTEMASSRLTQIELFRAVDRARLTQRIDDQAVARLYDECRKTLEHFAFIELDATVATAASRSFPVAVRALDAVHVASAEVLAAAGERVEFWTHDARQALAATARGLEVRGI